VGAAPAGGGFKHFADTRSAAAVSVIGYIHPFTGSQTFVKTNHCQ